jgi:hypothetical protein
MRISLSPSLWINWRMTDQIIGDSAEGEPTKPSKPGFVGFVGATPGELPIIRERAEDAACSQSLTEYNLDFAARTTRPMSWPAERAGE